MENNIFSKLLLYLFTILIIIIAIGFIANKQYRYIYNTVFIYLAYVLIIYYEKKEIINISNVSKSLIVFVSFLHLAFGQYFNLYKTSRYFDKSLHLIGGFTISLFIYQVLVSMLGDYLSSRLLVFILISSIGITSGVFLEILEFVLDILFKTSNQKGLVDTNLDLIFNAWGSSIAAYRASIKYWPILLEKL